MIRPALVQGSRYGWREALVMPSAYFEPVASSGGLLKHWNGSAFVARPLKAWSGSGWVTGVLKFWNSSAWQVGASP